MSRRYFVNFCLVLASIAVSLVLAEGFVRVFYSHVKDHVTPAGLFQIDDRLGWKLTSGGSFVHSSRYFEVDYTINRFGFRDRQREASNDGRRHRIVIFGDSQIFGWGVAGDKRFSALMESEGKNLEVLNLAVPGYGIDQQFLSYTEDAQVFEPDEAIIFVSPSTLGRMKTGYIYSKYKPRFTVEPDGALRLIPVPDTGNDLQRIFYKLLSPLYLPYFVDRIFTQVRASRKSDDEGGAAPKLTFGDLEKAVLRRAKQFALDKNQKLSVLVNLNEELSNEVRKFCRREGISFYETSARGKEYQLGEFDPHWSARANELIAREILVQMARP
jgi:hypothetical protein